jgi:hypothetical protein
MTYRERSPKYCDCGATFSLTVGEKQFYAVRGLTNEPKRCPQCHAAKKARRNSNGDSAYRSPVFQR